MTQVVFLELGTRWVSASLVDEVGANPDAPPVVFPARITSGASAAACPGSRTYQVAGGLISVGAPPRSPGPFIQRTGSTMPGSDPAAMEDTLLAHHALTLLNADPFAVRLVLLSGSSADAARLAAAMGELGAMLTPDPGRPLPLSVHSLSSSDIQIINDQARKSEAVGRECLIRCYGSGAQIQPIGESGDFSELPTVYRAFEKALLSAGVADDPSQRLMLNPTDPKREIIEAEARTIAEELAVRYRSAITPLVQSFKTMVLVGEDAPLVSRLFQALGYSSLVHRTPLSGYPIYASRAYRKGEAILDLPLGGAVAFPSPAELGEQPASRRKPAVRFSKDGKDVTLRIAVDSLESELVRMLRLFESTTLRSAKEQDFLMSLIRIDRR